MKNKIKVLIGLFIVLLIFANTSNTVKANITANLINEPLKTQYYSNLLIEKASSGNNYRNYFECGKYIQSELAYAYYKEQLPKLTSRYNMHQIYYENLSNINSYGYYTEINYTGIYNATYGFENEIGKSSIDIDFIDLDVSDDLCNSIVITSKDKHSNVLKINDSNNSGQIIFAHSHFNTENTIEFWIQTNDASKEFLIFYSDNVNVKTLKLKIDNNNFYFFNTSVLKYNNVGLNCLNDTWYHLKMEWNSEIGLWNLWINEIKYSNDGYILENYTFGYDVIIVSTNITDDDYIVYLDAIGFDDDLDYNINDNLIENTDKTMCESDSTYFYTSIPITTYELSTDTSDNFDYWFDIFFKFYKDNITYYGYETDGGTFFQKYNRFFNISTIKQESLEIQIHSKVGVALNGSLVNDLPLTTIKIMIFFNDTLYNTTYIEQKRLGTDLPSRCTYLRQKFTHHSSTKLNLTIDEIYGKYLLSTLYGVRHLVSDNYDFYNLFYEIPIFYKKFEIDERIIPEPPEPTPEPSIPTGEYWAYTTFMIEIDKVVVIEYTSFVLFFNRSDDVLCNVSMDFNMIRGADNEARFYYEDQGLSRSALGDWEVEFVLGVKVSFNWLRNVIVYVINQILVLIQFILYIMIVAFNYLIMFLVMVFIVPFFWNIIIYYLLVSVLYLLFILCMLGLFIAGNIWYWMQWVFEWLLNDVLPVVVEIVVVVFAWLLALMIWLGTMCQGDFDAIYAQTYILTREVADFFVESITILVMNFGAIILYIVMYIMLTFFCLFKHIFCKSKGIVGRSQQLQESLEAYMYPILIGRDLIMNVKDLIAKWT